MSKSTQNKTITAKQRNHHIGEKKMKEEEEWSKEITTKPTQAKPSQKEIDLKMREQKAEANFHCQLCQRAIPSRKQPRNLRDQNRKKIYN